jgi:hypothetical protein
MVKSLWSLAFIVLILYPKEKKLYQELDCNINTVTKLEIVCKGQNIRTPIMDTAAIKQFILVLKDARYFKDAEKFKSTLSYKLHIPDKLTTLNRTKLTTSELLFS